MELELEGMQEIMNSSTTLPVPSQANLELIAGAAKVVGPGVVARKPIGLVLNFVFYINCNFWWSSPIILLWLHNPV